jgi:hypothetical protein
LDTPSGSAKPAGWCGQPPFSAQNWCAHR